MKENLIKLDQKKLLFCDIECVSGKRSSELGTTEFELYKYKLRNKETDELPSDDFVIDHYIKRAALNPLYGKIISISIGIINGNEARLKTFKGEEKDILKDFVEFVNSNDYILIWWNQDFDLPYLRKRFVINGLADYLADKRGNDSMEKPWTLKGTLDLMQVWKGISFYNDSINEVAFSLGIKSPKSDMNGSQVSEEYYKGNIEKIYNYNRQDVLCLMQIFRKFIGQSLLTLNEDEVKAEKIPIIKKLGTGNITAAEEKKLNKLMESMNESEKIIASELLIAAKS